MGPHDGSRAGLGSIFAGARRFGLTEEEAWRSIDSAMAAVGGDATLDEFVDELAAGLAAEILAKNGASAGRRPRRPALPEP